MERLSRKVWEHLQEKLRSGPLHMTLIDPATSGSKGGKAIAEEATAAGTHAIMVGGSTGVTRANLDELVLALKAITKAPVIYFPSSGGHMSPFVDAIYFLSTLNSRNPRFITGEQMRGAPLVHAVGTEAIGMGYLLVEPGMTVGRVSDADLIPRALPQGPDRAVAYALMAEYFGMRLVYLEAGSGAPEPVPAEHVRAVREAITVPLVVGGGIRTREQAERLLRAGADILVTGTVAEQGHFERFREIVHAVKAHRRD